MRPYLKGGKLRLVEERGCPLPSVRFIPTYGHTPFHNAIELHSEGERMVVAGDAWVSRVSERLSASQRKERFYSIAKYV